MIKREKRKGYSINYPQYSFRVPEGRADQFDRIKELIEDLHDHYKKTQKADEKVVNRNDIVIEALELGLKALKKSK